MSARIARGSQGRSKPKGKGGARGSSKKAPPPGMLDSLPLTAETIRRVSSWILIGMVLAVLLALASVFQVRS